MNEFKHNMRVKITDTNHPLHGNFGTVMKLNVLDDLAWVRMDHRENIKRVFPFPRTDNRSNYTLLAPEQCSEADL